MRKFTSPKMCKEYNIFPVKDQSPDKPVFQTSPNSFG